MYNDGLGPEFEPAIDLLHRISPNITDAMVREQLPLCARILSFFADTGEYNVQAAELVLKFNRAHAPVITRTRTTRSSTSPPPPSSSRRWSRRMLSCYDYDSHGVKNC